MIIIVIITHIRRESRMCILEHYTASVEEGTVIDRAQHAWSTALFTVCYRVECRLLYHAYTHQPVNNSYVCQSAVIKRETTNISSPYSISA
jgi:hypothetical protein